MKLDDQSQFDPDPSTLEAFQDVAPAEQATIITGLKAIANDPELSKRDRDIAGRQAGAFERARRAGRRKKAKA